MREQRLLSPGVLALGIILASVAGPALAIPEYGNLPLSFEANAGQVADRQVEFLGRGQGYTLFLTPAEAVLSLSGPRRSTAVVRLRMTGGNGHPRVVGEDPLPGRSNYLLGDDPRQWRIGVPSYARVRYQGVYPGVDLVFRGNHRQIEYDFVITPQADPGSIRLAFQGADRITVGAAGELILRTAAGELIQPAPEVYQDVEGRRKRIEGRYVLLAADAGKRVPQVGFALGRYDRARPLVIDPLLAFSTFLGGNGDEFGNGIAVDSAGNAYVTGVTASTNFPGVGGGSLQPAYGGNGDAFVTKINAAGTAILYSTYLGGSDNDAAFGIAVDGAGNAHVTGSTHSSDFPGVGGASLQPVYGGNGDAFVTKINPAGTAILYSTYLGGDGDDDGREVAVDAAGNLYVVGQTASTTFPGVTGTSLQPAYGGGFTDGFVTKINPAGTAIMYSTFLGGNSFDAAEDVEVDGGGNAYVTGNTDSAGFPGVGGSSIQPAYAGGNDVFVTKINPPGTGIVYSTYLGAGGGDSAGGIAVDPAGNAYIAGSTASATFPGVDGGSIQPAYGGGTTDAFVTKINPLGTAIAYSTFLGGSDFDFGQGIAVDAEGVAHVVGETSSPDFPGAGAGSIQPVYGGGVSDAFVVRIDPAGTAILDSTYLGGSASDVGRGIALDGAGNAYVMGWTASFTFPGVTGSSIQPFPGGGGIDVFVSKISHAELLLQKGASPAAFTAGVPASYVLQVTNLGTAPTDTEATVIDTVPALLTLGALPGGCSAAGQTVTCTVPPNLAPGAVASFVIPVTPQAAADGTILTNTATLSGGDPACPAAARCSSTVSTPVGVVAGAAAPIPTLSNLMLGILTLLLAGMGVVTMRRRRSSRRF
jgi:hypothetical protein